MLLITAACLPSMCVICRNIWVYEYAYTYVFISINVCNNPYSPLCDNISLASSPAVVLELWN